MKTVLFLSLPPIITVLLAFAHTVMVPECTDISGYFAKTAKDAAKKLISMNIILPTVLAVLSLIAIIIFTGKKIFTFSQLCTYMTPIGQLTRIEEGLSFMQILWNTALCGFFLIIASAFAILCFNMEMPFSLQVVYCLIVNIALGIPIGYLSKLSAFSFSWNCLWSSNNPKWVFSPFLLFVIVALITLTGVFLCLVLAIRILFFLCSSITIPLAIPTLLVVTYRLYANVGETFLQTYYPSVSGLIIAILTCFSLLEFCISGFIEDFLMDFDLSVFSSDMLLGYWLFDNSEDNNII